MTPVPLPSPAVYFPVGERGYEVAPGLKPLGAPMGNGVRDAQIFQLDTNFAHFRTNKMKARQERLGKYITNFNLQPDVARAAAQFLAERFAQEHPTLFHFTSAPEKVLKCQLTGENLHFDESFELVRSSSNLNPPFTSALDALVCQVQEDVAVISSEHGKNWLSFLHLCSPSHWAAEDKIGKDFHTIHAAVPGIENINRAAGAFVDSMVNKGPFVRFVWGFGSDAELNCHPENLRQTFQNSGIGEPYLRIERQVTYPLPAVKAAIFTVHVYLTPGREVLKDPVKQKLLSQALISMSPESRIYKGFKKGVEPALRYLSGIE